VPCGSHSCSCLSAPVIRNEAGGLSRCVPSNGSWSATTQGRGETDAVRDHANASRMSAALGHDRLTARGRSGVRCSSSSRRPRSCARQVWRCLLVLPGGKPPFRTLLGDMPTSRRELASPCPWLLPLLVGGVLLASTRLYPQSWTETELGFGIYLTVIWSAPALLSLMAVIGALAAWRSTRRRRGVPAVRVSELLVVQIPTIGRSDVMPALRRVVTSMEDSLPRFFDNWRVDVVAEESSEAIEELEELRSAHVRVLYVPTSFRTAGGTKAKARANCWLDLRRVQEGESRDDVWVLHLDDDTAIGLDTAAACARFVTSNRVQGSRTRPASRRSRWSPKYLAQGVLTYPREFSGNRLVWLADAVRPASDLSVFRLTTGGGRPLLGAHGELLLVRSDVETTIGWDFGRLLSITEDANFALLFSHRYPGRSDWFPARCYGSSPESFADLVTQRRRWSRGLLHVACNKLVPLRFRLLLGYALTTWVLGPLQHVLVVLAVAAILGVRYTAPVQQWLLVPWALNMGVAVWMYLIGLRTNSHVSKQRVRPRDWCALVLIPVFSFIEGWAGMLGLVEFVKDRLGANRSELFQVIVKSHVAVEPAK
jgi:egghead protein (zeste-white 4 protein)